MSSFFLPVCLFWFGWTERASVHWIVPLLGSGLFCPSSTLQDRAARLVVGKPVGGARKRTGRARRRGRE
ncbi:hypothetical protein BC834DRAFT_910992 [Gloeopeniophorella convolvens]|nr:hypothetical protein BC834DRAFT_910992 [Gloeopeniophorella convolvens]